MNGQATVARPLRKGKIIELLDLQVINLHPALYVYGFIGNDLLVSPEANPLLANRPPTIGRTKVENCKFAEHSFALVFCQHLEGALRGSTRKYSFPAWPQNATKPVALIKDDSGLLYDRSGDKINLKQIPKLDAPAKVYPMLPAWPEDKANEDKANEDKANEDKANEDNATQVEKLKAELAAARAEAENAKSNYAIELQSAKDALMASQAREDTLKRKNEWLQKTFGHSDPVRSKRNKIS